MDTFIWYELMTPDVEGAKAFYGTVVGWAMSEGGHPGMPYTIVSAGTHGIGGIAGMAPPAVISYPDSIS